MARKPRPQSDQAEARRMRAAGSSFKDIAARFNANESSVRRWCKAPAEGAPVATSRAAPALGSVTPPAPAGATGTAPPGPAPAPGGPQAGPSAYERAKAAAAGQETPGAGGKAGTTAQPPLEQTAEQAAAALIMLTEVGIKVGVKFYAARCKVKLTPEIVRSLELSEEDRAQLTTYAPYAAPFLFDLLKKYGKYVGAVLYGLVFYDITLTRFAAIKELAPPPAPKAPPAPAVGVPAVPEDEAEVVKEAEGFKVIG